MLLVIMHDDETITLSSAGLVTTLPLNCIEDVIKRSGRRGKDK